MPALPRVSIAVEPVQHVIDTARHIWHEAQNQVFVIEGSVDLLETATEEAGEAHRERVRRACERLDALFSELREAVRVLEGELAAPRGATSSPIPPDSPPDP